jgi:two-component system nitrate/nitrite response regulator NarL
MQVLLCDDHAVFAESLALVLTRAGFSVAGVTQHPEQALEVLGRTAIDVCVLDLIYSDSASYGSPPRGWALPDDPFTFSVLGRLPELLGASPTTRFLLLTGFVGGDLIATAEAAGIAGIMNKGCHTKDIVAAIERVHAGQRLMAPKTSPASGVHVANLTDAQRMAKFLTHREREVLGHLVTGADTTTLAKTMGVSWTTARSHVQSVLSKLGAHSRLEAVTSAVRNGVVSGETGRWLL